MPILCFLDHAVAIQRLLEGGPLSHVDKDDGRLECTQVNRRREALSRSVSAQSPRLDSKRRQRGGQVADQLGLQLVTGRQISCHKTRRRV
jgi:hypothetical protein